MSTEIDRDQVRHIARLARFGLSEDEVRTISGQLGRIIEYVDKLKELETADVEPLAHPLPVTDVLRDDVPDDSFSSRQALANAPEKRGEYFRVPSVLDPHAGA